MASKICCMNAACGAATSVEWKKGWALRSGGYANLCYNCGSAYEMLVFCETFHPEESGWRECSSCNKRLHCGCVASMSLVEILDYGGVGCTSCARSARLHAIQGDEIHNEFGASTTNNISALQSTLVENRMDGALQSTLVENRIENRMDGALQSTLVENRMDSDCVGEGKLLQLGKIMEVKESNHLPQSQKGDTNASLGKIKQEVVHPIGEVGTGFLNLTQPSIGSSKCAKPDNSILMLGVKDMLESLVQPSLSIALTAPLETSNFTPPFPGGVLEGGEAPSPFQQSQRSRPIFPKPSKTGLAIGSEANKGMVPQMRVARPPAEGRGRNQLLPRYWPRITDLELQQLSGDLNSTIVPLFEKVLSASDAGRIGRLVLPKACAEAYFPPINQSEGLPIRIQDAKGKEWTFQFRFWPNNNSRMYVLEGVTPCIQSMQLQAGDTVTFSRIDPGGRLVIGFRKASNTVDMQDAETSATSALPNGALSGETSFSSVPTVSGFSGIFPSLKGSNDPHLNALSDHLNLADGDIGWNKSEKHQGRTNGDALQQRMVILEKKRTRNIGSKSKRLLMHSEDAMELRLTWEEAQDLLRPPPSVKPSIVTIEDHEFEEYDEPPVFGKRTIFTARPSRGQEQWAQCDNCCKWRRLPVDILLPPKWTCSDNVWDSSRCSCSAPDEMSPKELENIFRVSKDFKRRRTTRSHKVAQEHEPSGLDALASAAVLGDNLGDLGETSIGATTKHPRHRPGCTCIVCIQPPSGKGKHKPMCTCNVCMTVRRRFKTLMMRKKIRQSERQAEIAQKDHIHSKDESETNGTPAHALLHTNNLENERSQSIGRAEVGESSTGQIDLNCHPNREDLHPAEVSGLSMMGLVQAASFPLEKYMKQNGLTSLACEQRVSMGSCSFPAGTGESEERVPDERCLESVFWEHERSDEGHLREPNLD